MKRTVKLSLGMSFIMMAIALISPHLASPKLVLRFLPKDVYEAGKDHPAPSLPKQLLCHLLLAMAAVYMVRAYKDVTGGIKRERLSFGEAYKRLLTFLLVEKTFDIVCLDQILCMSTDYYQRCYPETKGCEGSGGETGTVPDLLRSSGIFAYKTGEVENESGCRLSAL